MTTLITLAIITFLLIGVAYSVSLKFGLIVSGVLLAVALGVLALQFYAGRWV